jgi:HTH-type transcriptional regulator/antitoxin HigA
MPSETEHVAPGPLIRELLDERGWSQRILALVLGWDEGTLSLIIAGKRDIDAAAALELGHVFGIPAERFLSLQHKYDLARARMLSPGDDVRLARRAALYGSLPVADMIKRGWLGLQPDDIKSVARVEVALMHFFGAAHPDDIEVLPHAAKKTDVSGAVTPAQLAWLHRVQRIANEILVPRYSASALRAALPKMRALLNAPENARHVPRILMECGIRFALVETIGDAKVDGACFWLHEGTAPVVAMSCRFDRIDNFWFVLRHELEHVLQGHGRAAMMLDADLPTDEAERQGAPAISEEERIANEAAAEFCVPQAKLRKFVTVKAPFYPERDMVGFARTLRVHPGIVAGQLRHATKRYELFRKHLVKIRSVVAPVATVDGWGDVVPLAK